MQDGGVVVVGGGHSARTNLCERRRGGGYHWGWGEEAVIIVITISKGQREDRGVTERVQGGGWGRIVGGIWSFFFFSDPSDCH